MDSRKDLYVTIAGNIKKERKRLSISQVQLAEKADVSVDTIKSRFPLWDGEKQGSILDGFHSLWKGAARGK